MQNSFHRGWRKGLQLYNGSTSHVRWRTWSKPNQNWEESAYKLAESDHPRVDCSGFQIGERIRWRQCRKAWPNQGKEKHRKASSLVENGIAPSLSLFPITITLGACVRFLYNCFVLYLHIRFGIQFRRIRQIVWTLYRCHSTAWYDLNILHGPWSKRYTTNASI